MTKDGRDKLGMNSWGKATTVAKDRANGSSESGPDAPPGVKRICAVMYCHCCVQYKHKRSWHPPF